MATYGFGIDLNLPYEQAIEQVTAALKAEGFGVLTTIDVRETLRQKLDVEFEPYTILGACNPQLAHRAFQISHEIGLLLPCNVIVHNHGAGTRVDIVDPMAMLGVVNHPDLLAIANEANERLRRVIASLQQ
jgi:uncharacterized protein (DUF302 family)